MLTPSNTAQPEIKTETAPAPEAAAPVEPQAEATPQSEKVDPSLARIKELESRVLKLKEENVAKRLKERETAKEKDNVLLANQEYKALAESLQTKLAEIEKESEETKASLQSASEDAKKYQEILSKRDAAITEQSKKLTADERAILSDITSIDAKERFLKITANRADAKASPTLNSPSAGVGNSAKPAKPKKKNLF